MAIWTDGSRLEDGSVGCAVARHHPKHDVWTGVRVHMGKTRRSTARAAHPFLRTPRREDHHLRRHRPGSHIEDHIQHTRDRTTGTRPIEQRRVSVQFRWVPGHAGTAGNEKADEWARLAARNERGSEKLPYEFSSTFSTFKTCKGLELKVREKERSWRRF